MLQAGLALPEHRRIAEAAAAVLPIDLNLAAIAAEVAQAHLQSRPAERLRAFVEWPDAGAEALGRPALEVRLRHLGGDRRQGEVDW